MTFIYRIFSMRTLILTVLLLTTLTHTVICHSQPPGWNEYRDGQRKTYKTTAKGVEISFEYPTGWHGEKGKRPNVSYIVKNESEHGVMACSIGVSNVPIPNNHNMTSKDWGNLLKDMDPKDLVPDGGQFTSGTITKIDNLPTLWITYSQAHDRAGIRFIGFHSLFSIYVRDKNITFACALADRAKTSIDTMQRRFNETVPLFQRMANSIIIHSQWAK